MTDDTSGGYYRPNIRTDEYQLLFMYLTRVETVGRHYRALSKAWYNSTVDPLALINFYSWADEYFHFAEENMKKHLSEKDYDELKAAFSAKSGGVPPEKDIKRARQIYALFQRFGWASGLLKLQTMTPIGKFGGVYAELGLQRQEREAAFAAKQGSL